MWVFGGQVGVAVGGLIGIKILTHLLSPYEFGRLSIANIIILLISVNVFGPHRPGTDEVLVYITKQGSVFRLHHFIR